MQCVFMFLFLLLFFFADLKSNTFIHIRAQHEALWQSKVKYLVLSAEPPTEKQTSVKLKMSAVNLLERLHLSRNTNTCSQIAFFPGRFLFRCCKRHRCPHWDFSASFLQRRGEAVKTAKRPQKEMWWVNSNWWATTVYNTSWKNKKVSHKICH